MPVCENITKRLLFRFLSLFIIYLTRFFFRGNSCTRHCASRNERVAGNAAECYPRCRDDYFTNYRIHVTRPLVLLACARDTGVVVDAHQQFVVNFVPRCRTVQPHSALWQQESPVRQERLQTKAVAVSHA